MLPPHLLFHINSSPIFQTDLNHVHPPPSLPPTILYRYPSLLVPRKCSSSTFSSPSHRGVAQNQLELLQRRRRGKPTGFAALAIIELLCDKPASVVWIETITFIYVNPTCLDNLDPHFAGFAPSDLFPNQFVPRVHNLLGAGSPHFS